MIKNVLISELTNRFGADSFRTGDSPIVVFPGRHASVGDVQIWDDGGEARLSVGDITHGHFGPYDEILTQDQIDREVTESIIDFLEALFADKVLLLKSKSGKAGGWFRLDFEKNIDDGGLLAALMKEAEHFLWSGPCKRRVRSSQPKNERDSKMHAFWKQLFQ